MSRIDIPDALAAEVAADLAAGGERARRWIPDCPARQHWEPTLDGAKWTVLNLAETSYPNPDRLTVSYDLAYLACAAGELVDSNQMPWGYILAAAVVGSAADPSSPRPAEGDRVLVLAGESCIVGQIGIWRGLVATDVALFIEDVGYTLLDGEATRWAILPPARDLDSAAENPSPAEALGDVEEPYDRGEVDR